MALSRALTSAHSGQCFVGGRISTLEETRALDRFLAGIERRAFRMAQIATGHDDEALDLVQEAMLKLVERYSTRDEAEWGPLFHRILQSKIRDWYRRTKVRSRWRLWLGRGEAGEETDDPLDAIADTTTPMADHQLKTKEAAAAFDAALRTLPLRQLRQRFGGDGQGEPPATPRQHDRSFQPHPGRPTH